MTARMVGLPVAGSQSAKYSGSPRGRPATSAGRDSRMDASELVLGKVVLRVQRDSRRSMRRAIMADSWGVGILKPCCGGLGGLEKMC